MTRKTASGTDLLLFRDFVQQVGYSTIISMSTAASTALLPTSPLMR